jgi:hypothetical protein
LVGAGLVPSTLLLFYYFVKSQFFTFALANYGSFLFKNY